MNELGVVEPIQLPPVLRRAAGWLRGLPLVAKIFVGLALVNGVDHSLQWVGRLGSVADLSTGVGLLISILWPMFVVLLPAAVWTRLPNAPRVVPLIAAGAIAVAVSALLGETGTHASSLIDGQLASPAGLDAGATVFLALLHIAIAASLGGGSIAVGVGLERIRRNEPSARLRRAAIAAGVLVAGASVLMLAAFLAQPQVIDPGDEPGFGNLMILTQLGTVWSIVPGLAGGYFAWALVRALADLDQRRMAVLAGAFAAGTSVVVAMATILSVATMEWLTRVQEPADSEAMFAAQNFVFGISLASGLAGAVVAGATLVAFALGIHAPRGQAATEVADEA